MHYHGLRLTKNFSLKMQIFSYASVLKYVLGAQNEYPQHMFWLRKRKLNFRYALLTKVLIMHITSAIS